MKIKFIAALGLAAAIGASGACRSSSNTNTTNTMTNMATATPTPIVKTTESAATDTTLKTKVETALKAKGFTDVTVDMTTTPATLRGTVAKGKMAEAVRIAQEEAGKPFTNQITEK